MIVFLNGPDDYRRAQKKKEIVADFKKEHPNAGLGLFDLTAEGAVERFLEFVRSQSIFESAKLAVLENAFEMEPETLAKLLRPLVTERSTTILISEGGKPVKALAFLTEKPSASLKFEALHGAPWIDFIKTEAKRLGLKFGESAAQFLGVVHEGNSWALVTELQKLGALRASGTTSAIGATAAPAATASIAAPTIEKSDLDALDLEAAPNYWALINGMKSYDVRIRLSALEKLFAMNDPPPRIFNILAAQAGPKTPRMAEYDLAIKSGKLDYEEALLDLILI